MTARRVRVCAFILTVAAIAVVDGQSSAKLRFTRGRPQFPRDGWWLHVDTDKTDATSIQFTFGDNPKSLTGEDAWTSSNPADMGFPDPLRTARSIHLNAVTTPAGARAVVCVIFQQFGVTHLEFTGNVSRTVSAIGRTASCTP